MNMAFLLEAPRPFATMAMLGAFAAAPAAAAETPQRLLLAQVIVAPSEAEYVAVFNPNAFSVDLSNYYLSDSDLYYKVVLNVAPATADFIARFPTGAMLAAGATVFIAIEGAECFRSACGAAGAFTGFGVYPDFEIASTTASHNADAVPDMLAPYAGAISTASALTNAGEPIVLFFWDGSSNLVTDVDYVFYGLPSVNQPAVNKSGVVVNSSAYLDDTADSAALHAALTSGGTTTSTCRRDFGETGQSAAGGNGVGGTDQTSEPSATTWQACPLAPAPDRVFADAFEI
jgi:hypothetical protein